MPLQLLDWQNEGEALAESNRITVISSERGVGATFLAHYLAVHYAERGLRSTYVGMDPRSPLTTDLLKAMGVLEVSKIILYSSGSQLEMLDSSGIARFFRSDEHMAHNMTGANADLAIIDGANWMHPEHINNVIDRQRGKILILGHHEQHPTHRTGYPTLWFNALMDEAKREGWATMVVPVSEYSNLNPQLTDAGKKSLLSETSRE